MKRKYRYAVNGQEREREYEYIPVRYIIAILLVLFEIAAIIAIVIALCIWVPYFYLAVWATEIFCVIRIIASDDNPDYKIPWLLFVLILPIAGFMLYFIFYSRTLKKKYVSRLREMKDSAYQKDDSALLSALRAEDASAATQAALLCRTAEAHLFTNTCQQYFPLGEAKHARLLEDLRAAQHFIFMEYFIIEEGVFWNSILDILKEKAAAGVTVRVIYDDIGCMSTLPGNYYKNLRSFGIEAVPFSFLRGNADSEFNNRSHRKITVIDGRIGYTGGINLADEYINEKEKHGHWKDVAVRLEGEAVWELTKLFLIDFGLNQKQPLAPINGLYPAADGVEAEGYLIPFGDGPRPVYTHRVGKSIIRSLLEQATEYVYITTPYLIIDNELCSSIENAALRGVDVKIITPHVPDKKLVQLMSRSYYKRLTDAGVSIYEYTPGFIHAKTYLADGKYAVIGTINLDYRSLVHHFENGVWMYHCDAIDDMKQDFLKTLAVSQPVDEGMIRSNLLGRIIRACVRVFAPLF